MQGLICEGTTEDSVRLSDDIRLVSDLSPRQVRVEIHAAGVCGSDMSCIHGKYYMPTPLIPGHETAGKVVEVGSAVTYCEVGDHVILSTFGNCGHCSDCEVGDPGNCAVGMGGLSQPYAEGDQALFNFANIGAFVQETIVAENQCIPIPKEMPLTSAAMNSSIAVAVGRKNQKKVRCFIAEISRLRGQGAGSPPPGDQAQLRNPFSFAAAV